MILIERLLWAATMVSAMAALGILFATQPGTPGVLMTVLAAGWVVFLAALAATWYRDYRRWSRRP